MPVEYFGFLLTSRRIIQLGWGRGRCPYFITDHDSKEKILEWVGEALKEGMFIVDVRELLK